MTAFKSPLVLVLMGVSGTGKTTLGLELEKLGAGRFADGDDFHPLANVRKMARGEPLDDTDRAGWLSTLAEWISKRQSGVAFLACSALKEDYRETLRTAGNVKFVFLTGSPELLRSRLQEREKIGGHFMPSSLLDSQLATLEDPHAELTLDVAESPAKLAEQVIRHFNLLP